MECTLAINCFRFNAKTCIHNIFTPILEHDVKVKPYIAIEHESTNDKIHEHQLPFFELSVRWPAAEMEKGGNAYTLMLNLRWSSNDKLPVCYTSIYSVALKFDFIMEKVCA